MHEQILAKKFQKFSLTLVSLHMFLNEWREVQRSVSNHLPNLAISTARLEHKTNMLFVDMMIDV